MSIGFLSHLDMNLYLFRLTVMRELVNSGHTVYAICPNGEYATKFGELGINHISYEIERGSLNPLKELKAIFAIYRAIKPLKIDILHAFTAKPNIYGAIAGRLAGIKNIICSVTGLGSFYIDESAKSKVVRFLIESLYRLAFALSRAVIFQNRTDFEYFVNKKIVAPQKAHLVRSSGVDTDYFMPSPFTLHPSPFTLHQLPF